MKRQGRAILSFQVILFSECSHGMKKHHLKMRCPEHFSQFSERAMERRNHVIWVFICFRNLCNKFSSILIYKVWCGGLRTPRVVIKICFSSLVRTPKPCVGIGHAHMWYRSEKRIVIISVDHPWFVSATSLRIHEFSTLDSWLRHIQARNSWTHQKKRTFDPNGPFGTFAWICALLRVICG